MTGLVTKWQTEGPRPGTNLYTSSVIGLDPDTGELKTYFQTLPHDAWDFDSSVGEFVQLEQNGQKYVVHPNKGGYIYVFDEKCSASRTPGRWSQNINFIQGVDSKRRSDRSPRHD